MSEIFNGKYLGTCQSLLDVLREEIENRIKDYSAEIKGQTYNLPFCPASEEVENLGVKKINHCLVKIKVSGQKYTQIDPNSYALFECTTCGSVFALNKSEALYIRKKLSKNNMKYEASLIRYKTSEILSKKAQALTEYANMIDNEGLTYSYKDSLNFIKSLEDKENRDISLEELEDLLYHNQFCGV